MSKSIEIKEPSKLKDILRIFSALDDARWSIAGNYNLINYCEDDLSPDEKLLTHWLCYTTDRQTAFQRVWDVGGYVISHLVREFTRHRETPVHAVLKDYLKSSEPEKDLWLECHLVQANQQANQRLRFYESDSDLVKFTSRFMPADALSIYRTLVILDYLAERSFTRLIYLIVHNEPKQEIAVRKLAASLHFLTYTDIGIVKTETVQSQMDGLETNLEKKLNAFRRDTETFVADLNSTFKPHKKSVSGVRFATISKAPSSTNTLSMRLN
ncbi:MAG: hypothetical protein ABSB84_09620 [Verrucomicrobiota bacterium]|jgi:hypothetical protein